MEFCEFYYTYKGFVRELSCTTKLCSKWRCADMAYTHTHTHTHSSYPDCRVKKDDSGKAMGVVGSVALLQNVTLATQPICSMDWSPDKVYHT